MATALLSLRAVVSASYSFDTGRVPCRPVGGVAGRARLGSVHEGDLVEWLIGIEERVALVNAAL